MFLSSLNLIIYIYSIQVAKKELIRRLEHWTKLLSYLQGRVASNDQSLLLLTGLASVFLYCATDHKDSKEL